MCGGGEVELSGGEEQCDGPGAFVEGEEEAKRRSRLFY